MQASALADEIDGLYASLSDGPEIPPARRAALEAELATLLQRERARDAQASTAHDGLAPRFVTAGRAIFTVSNPTGAHYTFKVTKSKPKPGRESEPPAFFVSLLTGPVNTSDYTYLGLLSAETGDLRITRKSREHGFDEASESVRVGAWALKRIWAGLAAPAGYAIQHAGRCGRCARLLTTPESIAIGIGPECLGKL